MSRLCYDWRFAERIFSSFVRRLSYYVGMDFRARVEQTIVDNQLLDNGNGVLIGLSGGPDSVALLHLLVHLRLRLALRLTAVYINHGLRPRAARMEERFCRDLCDRLSVEFLSVAADVPAAARLDKTGLEESARVARYAALEDIADRLGLDRIALGHQADDQIETILFRLLRGSGPLGLLGMPVKRGKIIRPLLHVTRKDVLAYLRQHRQAWCEDRSNQSMRFRRNVIRHRLIPVIEKYINPAAGQAVLRTAGILQAEEEYLDGLTKRAARKCASKTSGGKIVLDLDCLTNYDIWLQRRVLRHCLKATCQHGQAFSLESVDRLSTLAATGKGALALSASIRAVAERGQLYLCPQSRRTYCQELAVGSKTPLAWPHLVFRSKLLSRKAGDIKRQVRSRSICVDWDKLRPPLQIRPIRPGDRLVPLGMTGAKKVGDYLTDRKIPRPLRDEVPLVCDAAGIVWLVGYEIADRVKVDMGTRKVLTIAYGNTEGKGRPTI